MRLNAGSPEKESQMKICCFSIPSLGISENRSATAVVDRESHEGHQFPWLKEDGNSWMLLIHIDVAKTL